MDDGLVTATAEIPSWNNEVEMDGVSIRVGEGDPWVLP